MPSRYDDIAAHQFVAGAQAWLLKQEDGSLASGRATAARLQGFLFALLTQLGEAQTAVEAIPESIEIAIARGRLLNEIMLLRGRFDGMLKTLNLLIERGRPDAHTGIVFYCVTAPLLLGWKGNKDCTGPDPDQKWQQVAMAGEPIRIFRAAQELGAFEATQSSGLLVQYMAEEAETLAVRGAEIAAQIYTDIDKAVKKIIKRQSYATAIGVGVAGIAALFYFTRKK